MPPYFLFTESETTENEKYKYNGSPIVIHKDKKTGKIDKLEINGFQIYSPKEIKIIDISHTSNIPKAKNLIFLDETLIEFEMSYKDFMEITKHKKEINGSFVINKERYSFEGLIVNAEIENYIVSITAKVSILIYE